ncbi:MAG: hypothetical protein JWP87_2531 [Labilithrix sp.]|nr:hypothetical protein [Labilithrix sp.]
MSDAGTQGSRMFVGDRFFSWLARPVPILRLELIRIAAPLAILGFMSSRIAYADEWLGEGGFRVPDLGYADPRQPLYLPSLPGWAAWGVALAMVASGLALSLGFHARRAAWVFAATGIWVALSDRLAAFSVSKLTPVIAIALALSPCGVRFGIDAWRKKRASPKRALPREVVSGSVRFFQILVPVIYCASGIAKARADWLKQPFVLWTHLHSSYQTSVTLLLANLLPAFAWTLFQAMTLLLETFAPLWFSWSRTRPYALVAAVGMHAMIGLMFGPVRYFAMLMATLLIASHLSDRRIEQLANQIARATKS